MTNVQQAAPAVPAMRAGTAVWIGGCSILALLVLFIPAFSYDRTAWLAVTIAAVLLGAISAILWWRKERHRWAAALAAAEEHEQTLKLELDTVRFRTGRLREELSAADKQARLSHQLTLLGQFTAGFMHEFNNPLAIVAGRLEVLLEERNEDLALCADIEQMLKETRYMSRIAGTLLQALRRERANEVFEPSIPAKALAEAIEAIKARASSLGIEIAEEIGEAPRVDVPEHVVAEVVRGLIANSLKALDGCEKFRRHGRRALQRFPFRSLSATTRSLASSPGKTRFPGTTRRRSSGSLRHIA